MNNFNAYVTNIVYGVILLLGYQLCGIIPTICGFLTWFLLGKILDNRFESEQQAEVVSLAAGIAVAIIVTFVLRQTLLAS